MAWYPGSEKRAAAFKAAIPGVEELGAIVEDDQQAAAPSSYMPWLFKAGLSPEQVCPYFLHFSIRCTFELPSFLQEGTFLANGDNLLVRIGIPCLSMEY